MRQISTLSLLIATLSLLSLNSCQKGPDDTTPDGNSKCQLSSIYYFNWQGQIFDSMKYIYDGDKLSKLKSGDYYFAFEYTGDKITKRKMYDADTVLADYDTIAYNSDGTVAYIKSYWDYFGQIQPSSQYFFTYNNGKLTKFEEYDIHNASTQLELVGITNYTYTGNNISRAVHTDYRISGTLVDTLNYSYDNKKNYFTSHNVLVTDYYFFDDLDYSLLPLFFSANNVTNVNDEPDNYPVEYKVDGNDNIYELYIDGGIAFRYLHTCK